MYSAALFISARAFFFGANAILGNILMDKLQEYIGHVVALGGRCRLEAVVQADFYIDIHSFHPLFCHFRHLQSGPAGPWR